MSPGNHFSMKMPSCQCRKSHCGDMRLLLSSDHHIGISCTDKMTSWYWYGTQWSMMIQIVPLKCLSNWNIVKFHSPIFITESFWKFVQNIVIWLPCSVQNFRKIHQLRTQSWTNKVLQCLRCISDGSIIYCYGAWLQRVMPVGKLPAKDDASSMMNYDESGKGFKATIMKSCEIMP